MTEPKEPTEPSDLTELAPDFEIKLSERPCAECGDAIVGPLGGLCDKCRTARKSLRWREKIAETLRAATDSVPDDYRDATFANVRLASVVGRRAMAEARALRQTSVFFGPSGAGKTRLACACLYARLAAAACPVPDSFLAEEAAESVLVQAGTVRYVRAHKLSTLPDWHEDFAAFERASLLVVDDLGLEGQGIANLIDVLIRRCDSNRQTICTTSLGDSQIAIRYGDGVARRLFAHHPGIVLSGSPK